MDIDSFYKKNGFFVKDMVRAYNERFSVRNLGFGLIQKAYVNSLWKIALSDMQTINQVAREILEFSISKSTDRDSIKFFVVHRIFARAVGVMDEIIALIESGHTEGACARWRTLFELAVILQFMADYGDDEIFDMYSEHAVQKEYFTEKAIRETGQLPSLTDEVYSLYKNEIESYKQKYNFSKFHRDYGWAYKKLETISFKSIMNQVDVSSSSFYIRASSIIHADAWGSIRKSTDPSLKRPYSSYSGIYGMSIPISASLYSIVDVLGAVNQIYPIDYSHKCIALFYKYIEKQETTYVSIDVEIGNKEGVL
jgi:hypothetical protein